MKNVIILFITTIFVGTICNAQPNEHHHFKKERYNDLSIEQLATLKTKKMMLVLSLDKNQQEQVMAFHKKNIEYHRLQSQERKRENKNHTGTSEELFQRENGRLDVLIAQQEQLRKILTTEQFEQWQRLQVNKHFIRKRKMKVQS